MRWMLLMMSWPALVAAEPTMLVGVLTEQADRKCTPAGETWVNKRYEVGFVPLTAAPEGAAALLGQAVMVVGAPAPAPVRPKVESTAECMPYQMRSDWEVGLHGMRVRRLDVAPVAGFRADSVKPFEGLTAKLEGDQVVVTFQNTTGAPLEGVATKVHYEGCYGKPGSVTETDRVALLKPRSKASARRPQTVMKEARRMVRPHVMRAVSVVAKGPHVVFDLTVDGLELGAAVECPPRGGRK